MKFRFRLPLVAVLSLCAVTIASAADKALSSPSQATYILTNDDGVLHSYVSFFSPAESSGAPTLQFTSHVNTEGLGIGGGYFGEPRLAVLSSGTTQCVFASDAGTSDIAGVNIQTQQLAGNFNGSDTDSGNFDGIGLAVNTSYLYAGYTASDTIGTFAVLPGCQLSFLGDTAAGGLNGGAPAGMALHGNLLVLTYADGSIESFNVANGLPVSNNDEQNSTQYTRNGISFPDGVDITADGHYAIFGDSAINITLEVSDLSSGKLAPTVPYVVGGGASAVGPSVRANVTGINSASVRLSPDESMVYIGNNEIGSVAATFFNAQTGSIAGGCSSSSLAGFYNPWAFTGSLVTRDNTGTGGVLYVAEYGYNASYIGVLTINSNGTLCSLTESSASEVPDLLTSGLLSLAPYPPRGF